MNILTINLVLSAFVFWVAHESTFCQNLMTFDLKPSCCQYCCCIRFAISD